MKETEFSGARLACDLVLMCEIVSQTVFSRTRFLIDLVFFVLIQCGNLLRKMSVKSLFRTIWLG